MDPIRLPGSTVSASKNANPAAAWRDVVAYACSVISPPRMFSTMAGWPPDGFSHVFSPARSGSELLSWMALSHHSYA